MYEGLLSLYYYLILIKSANITPVKRWQQKVKLINKTTKFTYFFYKYKTFRKLTLIGSKNIHGNRFKYKTKLFKFFIKSIKIAPFVAFAYGSTNYPLKEYAWCKTLFNQIIAVVHTELTHPGFKFYPLNYLLLTEHPHANQIIPLRYVPINYIVSFVFNKNNNCMTYAKSSGANAIKKKHIKKVKLTYIELPSGQLKLLPITTYCVLAPNKNLLLNKIIEGGWGFYTKQKKKITVRGVAKNPVDHPNGGRTKAKQPELSPWGWIAKRNK